MKLRRTFIITIAFIFVSLFALSFNVSANTVETSELITVQGAQIRTSGNAGIRFVAKEEYAGTNETAYGIILAFGEAEANEEFVIDGTVNGKAVLKGEVLSTHSGVYTATLYNVPEEFYEQKVTARAYVVDGDKVVYSQAVATRSLAEVALAAKEDGDDSEFVNTICEYVNAPVFNYNGGAYTGEYKFSATQYNGGSTGYYVTLANAANYSSASNKYWDRILVAATEVANVYKVVAVAVAGAAYPDVEYDYIVAVHENCYDTESESTIKKIIALENATEYYLGFVAPTASGSCNVEIKVGNNFEFFKSGKALIAQGTTLPIAEKASYDFQGWFDNEALTGDAVTTHNGSKNYYAKFTPTTYTISYVLNDGTTTATLVEEYNVESQEIVLPTAAQMNIDGGNFVGWYDNADLVGDAITTIPAGSSGNITLHAAWYFDISTEVELTAADTAAITALNPTMVVSSEFSSGKYIVNGVEYKMNEKAFSTITAALAKAAEGEKIYVFAGSYNDALEISTANVTLYGPNYGVKGQDTRNAEALIGAQTDINAANVTLNGLGHTKPIRVGANFVTITNCHIDSTTTVVCNGQNRAGCIVDSTNISDLTVSNCYIDAPGTSNSYTRQYMSFNNVTNLTITGNFITNSEQVTASGSYAGMRIYTCSGVMNITGNTLNWGTTGYLMYIGDAANKCTAINIIDNVIDNNTLITDTAGILIKKGTTSLTTTVQGNVIKNCCGSTLLFNNDTGSTVNIQYNNFAAGTAFKVGTLASAKLSYTNNYYEESAYNSATSSVPTDFATYTHDAAGLAAYEAAYAAYKAQ